MKLLLITGATALTLVAAACRPAATDPTPTATMEEASNREATITPEAVIPPSTATGDADQPRLAAPAPPPVTYLTASIEEAAEEGRAWFRRYTQCLIDGDWPVTLNAEGDGFTVGSIPFDQRERFFEADRECMAEAGPMPVAPPPTPEEFTTLYDALLAVAECLENEGYTIDPAPSLEVFTDTYRTGPWHPYLSLPDDLSPAEWRRLERVCPQP